MSSIDGVIKALGLAAVVSLVPTTLKASPSNEAGRTQSVAVIEVYLKGVEGNAFDYARSIAFSLGGTGKYEVMEREEAVRRVRSTLVIPSTRLQQERLEAIEKQVLEGEQLLYMEPQEAIGVLSRARQELESISEGIAANKRLRDELLKVQMLLARSHLDSGNEAKAIEVLREVVRIYGDSIEVTEKDYHPRLVKLFQKVRKTMSTEKVASVMVETVPSGCEVTMDGRRLQGTTPHEYKGLYEGTHYVQVRCGDKESLIRKVQLSKGKQTNVFVDMAFDTALTIESGKIGLTFEGSKEADAYTVAFAARLGALINTDFVVAVGFTVSGTQAELKARLIDVKNGTEVRAVAVPAKTDAVTPSSVKTIVESFTGVRDIKVAEVPREATGETGVEKYKVRSAWYKNYWAWAACGVGVIGFAVGGALYWKYQELADRMYWPEEAVGWDETKKQVWQTYLDDLATVSNRYYNASIASFVIGGVGVATGTVLFILGEKGILKFADSSTGALRFSLLPMSPAQGGGVIGRFAW